MGSINHVFSAFSFIAFVLVSISYPVHLKARNVATCLHIGWVSSSNLIHFVNSILWDGNVVDKAPLWCRFVNYQFIATDIAIPATCLCIQHQIHCILINPLSTAAQNRRKVICELLLCIFLPSLVSGLAYLFEFAPYSIFEDIGCVTALSNAAGGLVLVPGARLLLSIAAGVYSCLNLYQIQKSRLLIRSTFMDESRGSCARYTRLYLLSGIDMLITVPWNLYLSTLWFPLLPWPGSSAALHRIDSHIPVRPASIWRSNIRAEVPLELIRWISVIYGFTFFMFLGLGTESRAQYMFLWHSLTEMFPWSTASVSQEQAAPQHTDELQHKSTTHV